MAKREPEHLEQQPVEQPVPAVAADSQALAEMGPAGPLTADSVIALQRTAGNAKVASALPHPASPATSPPAAERLAETAAIDAELAGCVRRRTTEADEPVAAPRTPSLLLRSQLRSRGPLGRAVLQRAVDTPYGSFDTEQYALKRDVDGSGNAVPAAQNVRGLDIKLKFTPNDMVDAEVIGLTQTAQSVRASGPLFLGAAGTRSIGAGDARATGTGAGETDEGAHIDQAAENTNPMYAVEGGGSTALSDAASATWGEHGEHYRDKANKLHHKDAKLIDTPRLNNARKDTRQVFETAALITKGHRDAAGIYLGSVRWGWHTDGAGVHTKIPLSKLSDGVPTSAFLKSAELWNASKTSAGADTLDLPVPDVKLASAPVTIRRAPQGTDVQVPAGTRLVILGNPAPPSNRGRVRVVDGMHIGLQGEVDATDWALITDERS